MNYFERLSESAQSQLSWAAYHLFHSFVYHKYKDQLLSRDEAKMLLSATIAYRYKFMNFDRGYFDKKGKVEDQKLIDEYQALPLYKEIKLESVAP